MLSYQGGIRVPSYTASKSAVMGLTRLMANEWAQYGINVNAIAPVIWPPITRNSYATMKTGISKFWIASLPDAGSK
ncbi:hypothetical protein ERHA55_23210 [Erwinia rhapontici]|nr:SDR family NAD(P)-dependent oxidoreductase [Erwinia rhapontici]BCQ44794.1 hypothetical protein ERHA55_23210 [Erwinia rhapontici]